MANILLTADNLKILKSRLRKPYPQIKSGHLTEAIACCAGYNSQAALLAAIKITSKEFPNLIKLERSLFAARLVQFGYAGFDEFNPDSFVRASPLPHQTWFLTSNNNLLELNRWFRECQRRNIPYVTIETRRKYVKLNWDCISIDTCYERHVRRTQGDELSRKMFGVYQKIVQKTPGKSMFLGSSFVGDIDYLWPEVAYEIADAFFTELYEPMKEQCLVA